MIRLENRMLRGVAFTLALLSLASLASAQEFKLFKRPSPPRPVPVTFYASGTYTGTLEGRIIIAGNEYWLSPDVQVYLLGVGLVPMGEVPIGASVYGSGSGTADTGAIRALIVRPGDEPTVGASSASSSVRILDPSAPR